MGGVSYPPPPWRLGGELLVSVFLDRHGLVGVAFARYDGDLAYRELLVAVARAPAAVTVTQIWVDSPASRAGGRELWGIPKEMATFGAAPGIAALRATAGRALPVPPFPLVTLQPGHLALNVARGRLRPLRAHWEFAADGPLAWLRGRSPVASFALTDARIAFGVVSRSAAPPTGRRRRRPPAARSGPARRR